jgi:arsenate reductase
MKSRKIEIYHNNRCGKSRTALELLQKSGNEIIIIDYLKNPPTPKELKTVLAKLDVNIKSIIREKEKVFIEQFKNKKFTDDEWVQILCEHPILIERPIVIDGFKAIVARPPELADELIKRKNRK